MLRQGTMNGIVLEVRAAKPRWEEGVEGKKLTYLKDAEKRVKIQNQEEK